MHQVTVLFNGRKQAVYLLDEPHIVIGRGRSAHIPLDGNPIVSRQHAVIRREMDSYLLEDLGGANGTFVNDKPADTHRLRDGDRIVLGKHTLRFEAQTPEAVSLKRPERAAGSEDHKSTTVLPAIASQPGAAPPWAPAPIAPQIPAGSQQTVAASKQELEHLIEQMKLKSGPHLSVNQDGKLKLVPLVDGGLHIGHTGQCKIRLPGNRWFGKVAASVTEVNGKWWLVARAPFWNPVYVGNSKVAKKRKLRTGTTIRVGELKVRFSLGEQE